MGRQLSGSSPAGCPHSSGGKSGTSKPASGLDGSSPPSRATRLGPRVISTTFPGRVLAQDVPDRSLGVEEGTDRATGQDPVAEVEAAGPKRRELEGGAPGHLLGVVGGDRLIVLAHLGRSPVANPLQQPGRCRRQSPRRGRLSPVP